jgi:ESF2/ABP1 family protein
MKMDPAVDIPAKDMPAPEGTATEDAPAPKISTEDTPAEDTPASPKDSQAKVDKKFKYGIIYLSYIPDGMTVKILREIMSQFGEVGRIYLEPDENNPTSKIKRYNEGWVEFKKKRVAKIVAETLNGTAVKYGKKHSRISGQIWSIKYLHKFKWTHLKEQLELDRAIREQKRRFEMTQAKKQVDFYQKMTERSKLMKSRMSRAGNNSSDLNPKEQKRIESLKTKQNKPIEQGDELNVQVDESLLSSIFKKVS